MHELFNFGYQPLAGFFPQDKDKSLNCKKYLLDLTICNQCGLLQVTNVPPITEIFHENYNYSSSTIKDLVDHFESYSEWLNSKIPAKSNILEFGCNDGVLLEKLRNLDHNVFGVDASDNVATLGRNKNLNIITDFFGLEMAEKNYEKNYFDLITCSNVFAHTDNIQTILSAVKFLLKRNGLFSIEVHDAQAIFDDLHYDFIYHEHLSYFDDVSIRNLLTINGFEVLEIIKTNMHGKGLRVLAKQSQSKIEESIKPKLTYYEEKLSLINEHIEKCESYTKELAQKGDLYGYGAAGRSQIFLNITKTTQYYKVIFDDSPLRQNRYIAGSTTPIKSYNNEIGENCVILAWNYADTISTKIKDNFSFISTMIPEIKKTTTNKK